MVMFNFLRKFTGKKQDAEPLPKPPAGQRLYAIGDIHGEKDMLLQLHQIILQDAEPHAEKDKIIVYLGDYIDRGPDSHGVIEVLRKQPLAAFQHIYLCGNHEDMMMRYLDNPDSALEWMLNGGAATCISYGFDPSNPPQGHDPTDWAHHMLTRAITPPHRQFLDHLQESYSAGDFLFVHAGVQPDVPLEEQQRKDLLWIREPFLSSDAEFGKVIIHGHTPRRAPEKRGNRIGIDTGACYGGHLTALVMDETELYFLTIGAEGPRQLVPDAKGVLRESKIDPVGEPAF